MFHRRIGMGMLSGSISTLVRTTQAVSIALVAALPWLGILWVVLVIVFLLRLLVRTFRA